MNEKALLTMSIYLFAFAVGMMCSLLVSLVSVWLAIAIVAMALAASIVYYRLANRV